MPRLHRPLLLWVRNNPTVASGTRWVYNEGMMNKEIDMNMEQALLISELAEIVSKLSKRDNIFAGKMIKAFDHFGKLTAAQEAVVRQILTRNEGS